MSETLLGVDPGRGKCGLAVAREGTVLARAVVATEQVSTVVQNWVREFGVDRIVVGNRTGSAVVVAALATVPDLPPVELLNEAGSTLEGRRRYFTDHPPRGWRRLIPLSLQTPPEAYDDYVALVLIERAQGAGERARGAGG